MSQVLRRATVACCVVAAAVLAYSGTEAWGWFLLVAVLLS